MIKTIYYRNFKTLRDTVLPLGRFTLLLGPNGSGKSTAMQAISMAGSSSNFFDIVSADLKKVDNVTVSIAIEWADDYRSLDGKRKIEADGLLARLPSPMTVNVESQWRHSGNTIIVETYQNASSLLQLPERDKIIRELSSFRIFSFDANAIAQPMTMNPGIQLESNGAGLAGVLENLRDNDPERFEFINKELGRWLPEFDRILFETPAAGQKGLLLRTKAGLRIKASDLSQGTLFALAFLTLANLPNPPAIVCFEEPDRGIHPRLLREISDAMYRLSYPEDYDDKRAPVQVIATTHSPYLLDLYRDHPEEVVIASKGQAGVKFERLTEQSDVSEILKGAPLGEVWYSGVLGGVPTEP